MSVDTTGDIKHCCTYPQFTSGPWRIFRAAVTAPASQNSDFDISSPNWTGPLEITRKAKIQRDALRNSSPKYISVLLLTLLIIIDESQFQQVLVSDTRSPTRRFPAYGCPTRQCRILWYFLGCWMQTQQSSLVLHRNGINLVLAEMRVDRRFACHLLIICCAVWRLVGWLFLFFFRGRVCVCVWGGRNFVLVVREADGLKISRFVNYVWLTKLSCS